MHNLGFHWSQIISCITILVFSAIAKNEEYLLDRGYIGSDLGTMASDSRFVRGCECYIWPNCISNCTFNELLRPVLEQRSNYFAKLLTPFLISFPYQSLRGRPDHTTSTITKQGSYALETKFWLTMFHNTHIQLILQRSQIHEDNKDFLMVYTRQQNAKEVESDRLDRCFYTGKVYRNEKVDGNSYCAVDTCEGLRGLIVLSNITYGIAPLDCHSCNSSQPHIIYPQMYQYVERDLRLNNTFWRPHKFLSMSINSAGSPEVPYILRIAFFVDQSLFIALGNSTETVQRFVSRALNLATKSFFRLGDYTLYLRLSYIEIWTQHDRIFLSPNIKSTMNAFVKHTLSLEKVNFNVLLSRVMFVEDVEYLSVPDSVCSPRAAAVIQVMDESNLFHLSRLLSIAIAEHMGLKSFPCPDMYPCNMNETLSTGDVFRMKLAFLSGVADCLQPQEGAPSSVVTPPKKINTCGNGQVDRGEECDLGDVAIQSEQYFSCCDMQTCLAAEWAECVHGKCCHNCTLLPKGSICRAAHDECDLPEFCYGDRGDCPSNIYRENGSPCDLGNALCYHGACPSRNAQCQRIWGTGSRDADVKCYEHFNNAASSKTCKSPQCQQENIMCGTLHCQGGQLQPLPSLSKSGAERNFGSSPRFFISNIGSNNHTLITCKYLGSTSPDVNVMEGTRCSQEGHFCFGNQCIDPKLAIRTRCPQMETADGSNKTCSGRGFCTNLGKCFCEPNWEGDRCDQVANQTDILLKYRWLYVRALHLTKQMNFLPHVRLQYMKSMDDILAFLAQHERSDGNINIAQFVVMGVIFLVVLPLIIAFIVVCYRRRLRMNRKGFYGTSASAYERSCDFSSHPNYLRNKEKWERISNEHSASLSKRNSRSNRRPSRTKHFRMNNGRSSSSNPYNIETGSFDGETKSTRFTSTRALSDPEEQGGNISSDSNNASAAEKMIKFGSMPSYRQDKSKHTTSMERMNTDAYSSPPQTEKPINVQNYARNSFDETMTSGACKGEQDSTFDILSSISNTSRHPEKGILKNKQSESLRGKLSVTNSSTQSPNFLSSSGNSVNLRGGDASSVVGTSSSGVAVVVSSSSGQFSSSDQTNTTTSSSQSSLSSEEDNSDDSSSAGHERRRRSSRGGRDMKDDDTFMEENAKPPVILCNAANQTDETSLLVDTQCEYEDNQGESSEDDGEITCISCPTPASSTLLHRGGNPNYPTTTACTMVNPYHTSDVSGVFSAAMTGRETPPPLPNPSSYIRLKCEQNPYPFSPESMAPGGMNLNPTFQQHKDLLMGQPPSQYPLGYRSPAGPQGLNQRNFQCNTNTNSSSGNSKDSTHSSSSPLLVQSQYSSAQTSPYAHVGLLDTLEKYPPKCSGNVLVPPLQLHQTMSLYPPTGSSHLSKTQPMPYSNAGLPLGPNYSPDFSGSASQGGDSAQSAIYYNDPLHSIFRPPMPPVSGGSNNNTPPIMPWSQPAGKHSEGSHPMSLMRPLQNPLESPHQDMMESNTDLMSHQATINDEVNEEEMGETEEEDDDGDSDDDDRMFQGTEEDLRDAFHNTNSSSKQQLNHSNGFNGFEDTANSPPPPPHLIRLGPGYATNDQQRSGPSIAMNKSTNSPRLADQGTSNFNPPLPLSSSSSSPRVLSPPQPGGVSQRQPFVNPSTTPSSHPHPSHPLPSKFASGYFPPPLSFSSNPISVNCLLPPVSLMNSSPQNAMKNSPSIDTNRDPIMNSIGSPEQPRTFARH